MDRFSKTTEIDVSNSTNIEDNTPRKRIITSIIAIVICLIISLGVWLYVVEIDNELRTKSYSNISVYSGETVVETVNLDLNGIRRQLIDISKSDIRIEKNADEYVITLLNDEKSVYNVKFNSFESGTIVASLQENEK